MAPSSIWEQLKDTAILVYNVVVGVLTSFSFSIVDAIDIAVVAFIIYKGIKLIRETRAEQLFKGFAILLISYFIAIILSMESVLWIFNNVIFEVGLIALLLIFQPELRRALEKVGRSNWADIGRALSAQEAEDNMRKSFDAICKTCGEFTKSKTGALIVIERSTMLGDIITTGTSLNADCTSQLLMNIFYPKSPLHDGAAVLRDGRISAAACILPLSDSTGISRDLGTRHRAALGMSENSDAIIVVVSEETGIISVAQDGYITRGFTSITLYAYLEKHIMGDKEFATVSKFRAIRQKLNLGRKAPDEKE